jgi:hypothetical protein
MQVSGRTSLTARWFFVKATNSSTEQVSGVASIKISVPHESLPGRLRLSGGFVDCFGLNGHLKLTGDSLPRYPW